MTRQNILERTTLKNLRSLKPWPDVFTFVFILLIACREEEPEIPIAIQFTSSDITMTEGSQVQVLLVLKAPAKQTGTVELRVVSNALYGLHYRTIPELVGDRLTLSVSRGQINAQFYIQALDNDVLGPNLGVVFGIAKVSAGFRINAPSTLSVSIASDDSPQPWDLYGSAIRVNLNGNRGSIPETQSSGMPIKVGLSKYVEGQHAEPVLVPAVANGEVRIKVTSGHATYGKEFITEPAATAGEILLKFNGTQTDTTFTIIPIDNSDLRGNRYISVSVYNVTGDIQAGEVVNYLLEIVDDEAGEGRIRWTKLTTSFATDLLSVEFFDEKSGYVATSGGLHKTDDGGLSWSSIKPSTGNYSSYEAHFLNEMVGFASGTIYECDYYYYDCIVQTRIFRTLDGGTRWTALGSSNFDFFITSMYFLSESIGVIGTANGQILKTTNGGTTWTTTTLLPSSIYNLFIFSNGTGYATAGNKILKTTDAGDSWVSSFATPNDAAVTSLNHSSTNTLYASWTVCNDLPEGFRVIYKSEDGVLWSPMTECLVGGTLDFSLNTDVGISSGAQYWNEWLPELHLSVDNGSSWIPEPLPPDSETIRDVHVAPNGDVFVIDGNGQFLLKGVVE